MFYEERRVFLDPASHFLIIIIILIMKIIFHADSDLIDVSGSVQGYQNIWDSEGDNIVTAWKSKTGLLFRESFVNAIVFEGRGQSHPLSFRASLSPEMKKATIIHELGHRILYKKIKLPEFSSLENHKHLNLCFYDILIDLDGIEFANRVVEEESKHPLYKEAWGWALSLSKEQRAEKIKELLQ